MDEKQHSQHHEAAVDPYAGFSPEDADHLRKFQGKAGKKVVRKVILDQFRLYERWADGFLT